MKKIYFKFLLLISSAAFAQNIVPVGLGSYASFPPAAENVTAFATRTINVPIGNTKPIPTNDWWTQVLTNDFAGNLHAYPITINPENYGCQLLFPIRWTGNYMVNDVPLTIKGTGFNPTKNIAKNWNDWGVTVNLQDAAKSMDITLSNGAPMAWFEINGFEPTIEFGFGLSFYKADGSALTFPFTGSNFCALYQGKYYGFYAPNNTTFTFTGNTVTLKNTAAKMYFTVAAMKDKTDLNYYNTFAYSIPRNTKVTWNYQPENAKIDVNWTITTENLKGEAEKRTVQGFLPHHYKNCTQNFTFNNKTYATPRGQLKCAEGNSFSFSYAFTGVLAHTPAPTVQPVPNPYDPAKMKSLTDAFATRNGYGDDTYFGAKELLNYAKTALIAKETGNANYISIRDKSRNSLIDWYTYTPGETEHYFARYDKWKALVGFNTNFGSDKFNDHHFHYGYHIFATALLGMVDQDFLNKYAPMAKQVLKEYANWDRTDLSYPFLRTFSPWKGHSYANGLSTDDGNDQESTSEAMQSWAGMFLLGDVLGDKPMRDAGAFGYMSESRATREYWFDVDNENFPSSYSNSSVGILWDNSLEYRTFFGSDPLYVRAIQWLPYSPAHDYMSEYPDYLKASYKTMATEQVARFPSQTDESGYGEGWGNVALSFQQIFDPAATAKTFDTFWAAPGGSNQKKVVEYVAAPQTYYYTHSHRSLGDIQLKDHTSAPNSRVYFNTTTNKYSYVGYNSLSTQASIKIYKNGIEQGLINVPANSFFNRQTLDVTAGIESDYEVADVNVFPNPTSDLVNINDADLQKVECFDATGRIVATGNGNLFSMAALQKGVYMLKIYRSQSSYTRKILKE